MPGRARRRTRRPIHSRPTSRPSGILTNNPEVITSSFGFTAQVAPGSPFYFAARELFIDAALRNISVFSDNGDGGSGDQYGNGLTNVQTSRASPFGVMVGGTVAQHDERGDGRWNLDRCRGAGAGPRSGDDLAARCRRVDEPAELGQWRRDAGRDRLESILPQRHSDRAGRERDRVHPQQHGFRRRRSQPARSLLPARLRLDTDDVGPGRADRPWHA